MRYLKHLAWTASQWALSTADDVNDILVGGQAVIEGVMMRSPKAYSVAVRRQNGEMTVTRTEVRPLGERWPVFKLPVVRGVGVLGQSLVLGIKSLQFSANEAMKDLEPEQKQATTTGSSWFVAGNLALALAVNIALFVGLPLLFTRLVQSGLEFDSRLVFNAIDGVFRVLIFLGFISSVSLMKDMRRVFEFHGAEHKTVYNFESRQVLSVDNARPFSTLHPRCGTSFLLVVMIVSILVFSLVHFDTVAGKLLSRIALLPLVAGVSYEIIRYSAKHPQSFVRWVTLPGLWLQKITTRPPDDRQIEVAIRALEEALAA